MKSPESIPGIAAKPSGPLRPVDSRGPDCFVAALLAMTRGAFFRQSLAALALVGLLAGCGDPFSTPPAPLDKPLPWNFHELDSGKAYRSGQPQGPGLQDAIDVYRIKTVINLRGVNPGDAWYNNEAATCVQNNVALVSFAMSNAKLPEPDLLKGIVTTLKTAHYPILIHCEGGADRTGAIAAVYRMLIAGDSKADAQAQLSPWYFHFRSQAPRMDDFINLYEPTDAWLDYYTQNYDSLRAAYPDL